MVAQTATVTLRVEYTYDAESRNWSFVVPILGIVGGAESRDEAEQLAVEAVAFTLEGDSATPAPTGSEIGYLRLTFQR